MYVRIAIDPPLPLPAAAEDDGGGGGGDAADASDLSGGTALVAGNRSAALAAAIALRPIAAEPGRESRAMLRYAAAWAAKHSRPPRHGLGSAVAGSADRPRHVRALVQGINGELVLLTRFLCPQPPPPEPVAAYAAAAGAGPGGLPGGTASRRSVGYGGGRASAAGGGGPASWADTGGSDAGSALQGPDGTHTTTAAAAAAVSDLVPRLSTMESVARFVSLVPFIPDSQVGVGGEERGSDWVWEGRQGIPSTPARLPSSSPGLRDDVPRV